MRNVYEAAAEVYAPAFTQFLGAGALNFERENHISNALPDGTVWVCGGDVNGSGYSLDGSWLEPLSSAQLFAPGSGSFSLTGSLQYEVTRQAGTRLDDGRVLVVGGVNSAGNAVNLAEVFH